MHPKKKKELDNAMFQESNATLIVSAKDIPRVVVQEVDHHFAHALFANMKWHGEKRRYVQSCHVTPDSKHLLNTSDHKLYVISSKTISPFPS